MFGQLKKRVIAVKDYVIENPVEVVIGTALAATGIIYASAAVIAVKGAVDSFREPEPELPDGYHLIIWTNPEGKDEAVVVNGSDLQVK